MTLGYSLKLCTDPLCIYIEQAELDKDTYNLILMIKKQLGKKFPYAF